MKKRCRYCGTGESDGELLRYPAYKQVLPTGRTMKTKESWCHYDCLFPAARRHRNFLLNKKKGC